MLDRELMISLYWSGRMPDMAHQINATYTIQEYTDALNQQEFIEFATAYDTNFISGIDGLLLGRLQLASDAMSKLPPDSPNLPKLMAEYSKLLDKTKPIIERLSKIHAEATKFDGFIITLRGDDEQKTDSEGSQNS